MDRRGYPVHLLCAVIGLLGLLAYDGVAEWLVVLPVAACLIRGLATWRSAADALGQSVCVAILAAGVWSLSAVLWSSDPVNGLDEVGTLRNALLVPALWPLRDHRGLLIAALAVGFGLGNLTQIGHAVGVWGDVAWLRWPRLPDRNSGWWDPVVGGTLLCGAVGLHVPAALWGRGRSRWVGVLGVCAAIAGVVATGTRGAWLASAALVGLAIAFAVVRAMRRGAGADRRGVLVVVALGVVSAGVAGVVAGPAVMGRASRGVGEIQRAVEQGDFASDTGRRLLMWIESWRAWRAEPLRGIGTGGLADWARVGAASRGVDAGNVLDHAHGMWVHIAAVQGTIGVGLWGWVIAAGIASGLRRTRRNAIGVGWRGVGRPDARGLAEAYALGPVWALGGLALAGVFDVVHINSQTSMLLFAVLGLCAMGRRGA